MARMIDQIRASKLPSNMMQFAARGALQVPAAENIEILVYLALHNKVFGELARMTLAGWDEKSSLAAAVRSSDADAKYWTISYPPDNLRPRLLPALLQNPSVTENAVGEALRPRPCATSVEVIFKSHRAKSLPAVRERAEVESVSAEGRSRGASAKISDRPRGR